MLIEHILAWKEELWGVIEPCLVGMKLKGNRKVYDMSKKKKVESIQI